MPESMQRGQPRSFERPGPTFLLRVKTLAVMVAQAACQEWRRLLQRMQLVPNRQPLHATHEARMEPVDRPRQFDLVDTRK
jgi:hypothetical protein